MIPPASNAAIIVAVVVAVLSFAGTIIAAVYTARSSRAASRETSQMKGWTDLTTSHQADIARLRKEQDEDRERHRREREEDRAALDRCNDRITDLTRQFEHERDSRREVVRWARQVVQLMRAAQFDFPAPPPGVDDEEHNGVRKAP